MVDILSSVAFWSLTFWQFLSLIAYIHKYLDLKMIGTFATYYHFEVKPFYFTLLGTLMVTNVIRYDPSWWALASQVLINAYNYWIITKAMGDDDDDRWNKRRQKLVEKVRAFEGRLVVVPS